MSGSPRFKTAMDLVTNLLQSTNYVAQKAMDIDGKDVIVIYFAYIARAGAGGLDYYVKNRPSAEHPYYYHNTVEDKNTAIPLTTDKEDLRRRDVKYPSPQIPSNANGNTVADSTTFTDTVTDLSSVEAGDVLEITSATEPSDIRLYLITEATDSNTLQLDQPFVGTQNGVTYTIWRPDRWNITIPVQEFHGRVYAKEETTGDQGYLGIGYVANTLAG